MFSGRWRHTMKSQGVLWILLGLLLSPQPGTASLPLVMDSLIQALAEVEEKVLVTEARRTASAWMLSAQDSYPLDLLHNFLLETPNLQAAKPYPQAVSPELQLLMDTLVRYGVRGGQEYGVVLAPDGSTVAVRPLLAGLEAGLQGRRNVDLSLDNSAAGAGDAGDTILDDRATSQEPRDAPADDGAPLPGPRAAPADAEATSPGPRAAPADAEATSPGPGDSPPDVGTTFPNDKVNSPTSVDSLLAVTLAGYLGLAFLQSPQTQSQPGLGTEGCWDQLSNPHTFTLLEPEASRLTMAFLNGALDGALLGDYLSRIPEARPPLSHLLSQYYGAGVAGDPGFRSNFRRRHGAALISAPTLTQQVWGALALLQRLQPGHPQLRNMSQEQLAQVAALATKEFTEAFLGCPAIHPRCRWGAAQYKGRPTSLELPLGFLYVHHTYEPASPCTTLERCAADMRSMQRFHQDTRGWDDIGYSFVVGSDGYVYEGRGWHWVGAHTRGHNSIGFGVAVVGNYTAALPDKAALSTLRDALPRCAVRAGLLRPDYQLLGHRQLVHTSCPGDALFALLRTWPHFAETGN